jgi:hypothetical protein
MTTVELPLAHTVVTDAGGSYGYSLLAASPGVSAEEADFLGAASGASDYLHTTEGLDRPFLSFFPLPTGRWALMRRFLHGKRRGNFNRVVSHTLLFDDGVLHHLADDPWLLASASRLQATGRSGTAAAWGQWEERLGDPGLTSVEDLLAQVPADAPRAAAELADERRGFLRSRWGDERLEAQLAWILAALLDGRRLILPQDRESEILLALAWSSLPREDRRNAPWTTHFAPGVRILFRLINADPPEQARRMHDPMEEWAILGEESVAPGVVERGAAQRLGGGLQDWREIRQGCEAWGLSFIGPGTQTRRWVDWVLTGRDELRQGFTTVGGLETFLRDRASSEGEVPWLTFEEMLLPPIAETVTTLAPARGVDETVAAVATVLRRTGHEAAVRAALGTTPPAVGASWQGRPELRLPLVALALGLAEAGGLTVAQREGYAAWLLGEDGAAAPLSTDSLLARAVAPELALALARKKSARSFALLQALHRVEGGLEAALARLKVAHAGSPGAAWVLRSCCQQLGEDGLAAAVDREVLIPGLAPDGPLRGTIPSDALAEWLEAMAPEALGAALTRWRGEPYALALERLEAWTEGEPERAQRVAMALAEGEDGPQALAPSERLGRVAAALQGIAVPTAGLVPFLATAVTAETEELVGVEAAAESAAAAALESVIQGIEAEPGDDRSSRAVLRTLQEAATRDQATPQLRSLIEKLVITPERTPRTVDAALHALIQSDSPGWIHWADTVARCADRLEECGADQRQTAHHLRRDWCIRAALMPWEAFPAAGVALVTQLAEPDHGAVLQQWTPQLPRLGGRPGEAALLEALQGLAQAVGKGFELEVARIRGAVERQTVALAAALNHLDQLAEATREPSGAFSTALDRVLPPGPEQSQALVELFLGREITPRVRYRLHQGYLDQVARYLYRDGRLKRDISTLVGDDRLLLRVCHEVGGQAQSYPANAGATLVAALEADRSDAVEALLAGVGHQRRAFLKKLPALSESGTLQRFQRDPHWQRFLQGMG